MVLLSSPPLSAEFEPFLVHSLRIYWAPWWGSCSVLAWSLPVAINARKDNGSPPLDHYYRPFVFRCSLFASRTSPTSLEFMTWNPLGVSSNQFSILLEKVHYVMSPSTIATRLIKWLYCEPKFKFMDWMSGLYLQTIHIVDFLDLSTNPRGKEKVVCFSSAVKENWVALIGWSLRTCCEGLVFLCGPTCACYLPHFPCGVPITC